VDVVWQTKAKSKSKSILVVALLILSLSSVIAIYATGYTQTISENINLITNSGLSSLLNFNFNLLNSIHDWGNPFNYPIGLRNSINDRTPQTNEGIGLCMNTTDTNRQCGAVTFDFNPLNSVADINVTGSCVAKTTIAGDGQNHTLGLSNGSCVVTLTLPSAYAFSSGKDTVSVYSGLFYKDSYYQIQSSTVTHTVTDYVTTTIYPQYSPCNNVANCADNQLAAVTGNLLFTLILMAVGAYALLQMGVRDERAYVFLIMMAIDVSAYLGSIGAMGAGIVPWYVAIFVNIIGFLFIMMRGR
jgi:hypothetical protein